MYFKYNSVIIFYKVEFGNLYVGYYVFFVHEILQSSESLIASCYLRLKLNAHLQHKEKMM